MPASTPDKTMRYEGALFRALNPIYAREPMSGRGAELYGGRFNKKGTPALYTCLTVMIALREANQAGSLQPTTLISYDADIGRVFDTRDEAALLAEGMAPSSLADPTWRDQMKASGEASTQAFARHLAAAGYHGLLVRSFAPGANADDLDLVLWQWGAAAPARLTLIDDEKRLSRWRPPPSPSSTIWKEPAAQSQCWLKANQEAMREALFIGQPSMGSM